MVRADTLDLQDTENPTAAEHNKHPDPNGLAPHQASQVHHVIEERNSEEQILADAWNSTGSFSEDPYSMEETDVHGEHDAIINGAQAAHEDTGDGADAEGEGEGESDDDMMDRISSSPSIDDGGYTQHFLTSLATPPTEWPARTSSLSPMPLASMRDTSNQSAQSTPDSSSFVETPQHLPLPLSAMKDGFQPHSSASVSHSTWDSARLMAWLSARRKNNISFASNHHRTGRYVEADDPLDGQVKQPESHDQALSDTTSPDRAVRASPRERHTDETVCFSPTDANHSRRPFQSAFQEEFTYPSPDDLNQNLVQSPSLSSIISVDLDSVLLPTDDPLLDTPPSPSDPDGSWESASDSDSYHSDEGIEMDDDANDAFLDLDSRFVDSGWGGECLLDTEDIDFEFVYALHTFVATVEGQANATKGDTMVLLDDSNSYWWLVRVVKNSSIGYLPAEHIETPTERLARLNKHRNIDLSATMLSDNTEKSKNSLMMALRRRGVKTVQFAAPTYVEASDNEYSTDDEEHIGDPDPSGVQSDEVEPNGENAEPEETAETKQAAGERLSTSSNRASFDREQAATAAQALADAGVTADEPQLSPKLVDNTEAAPLKSRKGTSRNADSFLKDDSSETRKITLTPGLLREDSGSERSPVEPAGKASMEGLTKAANQTETSKPEGKEKKKEPKKGGMLSGLFKSKKKENKAKQNASENRAEQLSIDTSSAPSTIHTISNDLASPSESLPTSPPGSSNSKQVQPSDHQGPETLAAVGAAGAAAVAAKDSDIVAELEGSTPTSAPVIESTADSDESVSAAKRSEASQSEKPKDEKLSPLARTFSKEGKPKKAKRSKQRVELDDFDTPSDEEVTNPFTDPDERWHSDRDGGSSESLVKITPETSFLHGPDSVHGPARAKDAAEAESRSSSPSIIEHPSELVEDGAADDHDATPIASRSPATPTAPGAFPATPADEFESMFATPPSTGPSATATSAPETWSDANLRSWLDDNSEVRDMLVMIHDKSGLTPVHPDHPLMQGLFVEQSKGVQSMMDQLDGLLGSYLQRKGVKF